GRSAEPKRRTRQIGADDQAISASEIQAHLAGPTAGVNDTRLIGNCLVEESRKHAPFGPCAKRVQTIARWISGERSDFVKPPDGVGAGVTRKPQVWNSLWRLKHFTTLPAGQIRLEPSGARRTCEQIPKAVHSQKMA